MGEQPGRGPVPGAHPFTALHHRQQPRRQFLAEFHAPLIEGVDAEEGSFHEDAVFVERQQPAQREGVERPVEDGQRGAVARKYAMRRRSGRPPASPAPLALSWARASSSVRPLRSASDWARQLASSRSW